MPRLASLLKNVIVYWNEDCEQLNKQILSNNGFAEERRERSDIRHSISEENFERSIARTVASMHI